MSLTKRDDTPTETPGKLKMPSPITSGRPRDWQVGSQSRVSARQLHSRAVLNEGKTCSCPGCSRRRVGISRYCATHKDTTSTRGDPLSALPTRNQIRIFEHAIKLYLDTDPKFSSRVSTDLSALDKRMTLPPTFCLNGSDIHPKLPRIARAKGLLANYQHRKNGKYSEAVIHALALIGWMRIYYDTGNAGGLMENREAFLKTQAGAFFGSNFGSHRLGYKQVSGATHRHLGRDLIRSVNTVYGLDFWSAPVSTQAGQALTLLDYTKIALRSAKLL